MSSRREESQSRQLRESIIATLKNEHRYHDALKVWNDITSEKYRAEVGRIFDGSFEEAGSLWPR